MPHFLVTIAHGCVCRNDGEKIGIGTAFCCPLAKAFVAFHYKYVSKADIGF